MRIDDPQRPKNALGYYCLLNSNIVIPTITVIFFYSRAQLCVNIPINSREFSLKHIDIPYTLAQFFEDFWYNPEEILCKYFNMQKDWHRNKYTEERRVEVKVITSINIPSKNKVKLDEVEF